MNTERTIEEINAHRHQVIHNPEQYRVKRIKYEEDRESQHISLDLWLVHQDTGHIYKMHFSNPRFNYWQFQGLWDATGLYFMTTDHLGWGREQRIEVGDWDGGPALLWAEEVTVVEE